MNSTKHYDLDIDTTLGGNSASDYIISSQKAIKSYVDNHSGGGSSTDVQINGTSITSQGVANIITNSAYNASSNKIATMSDIFSRNIGEIVTSTIPLTDAGLHLLDGALISGSGSYADFVTYIAGLVSTYPDLFETEANWQSAVTTYGVCGKFVYDSVANTVRLPKITGFIEGTTDLTALGDLVEAGLPNITGNARCSFYKSQTSQYTGAFSASDTGANATASAGSTNNDTYYFVNFDASNSNSIYGNSNTVQPQTIKVLYYIVVATSSKPDIQVDIDEIATDLNGKADVDLTNINASCKPIDGQWVGKLLDLFNSGTATSRTHDLSSYLPTNDKYEVMFSFYLTFSSAASALSIGTMTNPYDNRQTDGCISHQATVNTNGRVASGTCIIPVTNRTVYSQISATLTLCVVRAIAYRRIGTNQ